MGTSLQEQKKEIGERLLRVRLMIGVDQGKFAADAGIAGNTYNQYEQGQRVPKIELAIKLCETYDITLDWIYRGDPSGLDYAIAVKLRK